MAKEMAAAPFFLYNRGWGCRLGTHGGGRAQKIY